MRSFRLLGLGMLSLGMFACSSVELAPPTNRARTGPALSESIRRVVAVRATCGSLSSFNRTLISESQSSATGKEKKDRYQSLAVACPSAQIDGVDQIVRSSLEFYGYRVIDSERVNAVTAKRVDVRRRETIVDDEGVRSSGSREVTTRGSLFGDAPPALQDEILKELGAEGVLNARILVGAPIGRSLRRHIDVQVRLLHIATGELVWASRCRIEAGWTTNEEPIAEAARCAVDRAAELRR